MHNAIPLIEAHRYVNGDFPVTECPDIEALNLNIQFAVITGMHHAAGKVKL